jgi:hypothetical protein
MRRQWRALVKHCTQDPGLSGPLALVNNRPPDGMGFELRQNLLYSPILLDQGTG